MSDKKVDILNNLFHEKAVLHMGNNNKNVNRIVAAFMIQGEPVIFIRIVN